MIAPCASATTPSPRVHWYALGTYTHCHAESAAAAVSGAPATLASGRATRQPSISDEEAPIARSGATTARRR
jgi:hypothetical protein